MNIIIENKPVCLCIEEYTFCIRIDLIYFSYSEITYLLNEWKPFSQTLYMKNEYRLLNLTKKKAVSSKKNLEYSIRLMQ